MANIFIYSFIFLLKKYFDELNYEKLYVLVD